MGTTSIWRDLDTNTVMVTDGIRKLKVDPLIDRAYRNESNRIVATCRQEIDGLMAENSYLRTYNKELRELVSVKAERLLKTLFCQRGREA